MTVTALSPNGTPAPEAPAGKGKKAKKDKAAKGEKKGGKKKLLIIVLVVLLLGGGAYWFVLRPKPATAPVAGTVVPLDPIQVNLAGGHYLKVGIALQLVKSAKTADGSKALDALIDEFSGRPMDQLARPGQREHLKAQLAHRLESLYDHDVMGVYFTDFVTQ